MRLIGWTRRRYRQFKVAEELLDRLGATEAMAKRLCRYPVVAAVVRIVVEAMDRGVGEDGCLVAAMLEAGDE